jgi:hypothetical protein
MKATRAGKPMNLVMPIAALGVGGALVVADLLRVGCFPGDDNLAVLLVLLFPAAAVVLGIAYSWANGASWRAAHLLCAAATCAKGAVLGALIGEVCWGDRGFAACARDGAAIGAGFAIAFATVGAIARRAGRARPWSVIDTSDRLLVAATVAALLGISAGAVQLRPAAYPTCPAAGSATPVVAVVSTITLVVIVGLQSVWLAQASAVMAKARSAIDQALVRGAPCVDYGIGDELVAEYGARRNAYRDAPSVVGVTRGSASVARRALVEALAVEAALLVPLLATCRLALA